MILEKDVVDKLEEETRTRLENMAEILEEGRLLDQYISLYGNIEDEETVRNAVNDFYDEEALNGDADHSIGFYRHLKGKSLAEAIREGGKARKAAESRISNQYYTKNFNGRSSYPSQS